MGDDHGNVVLLVLSDRNHCHGHRDRVGIVGHQLLLLGRVEALRRESPILRCHLHAKLLLLHAVLLLLLLLLLHRLVVEPAAHRCHHLHAAFLLRIEGLLMLLILRAHVKGPRNHLGGMACWRGVDALARSRTCNCNGRVASYAEPPDTAADRTTTTQQEDYADDSAYNPAACVGKLARDCEGRFSVSCPVTNDVFRSAANGPYVA